MTDATTIDTVRTTLLRRYMALLGPAAALFAIWAGLRQIGAVHPLGPELTTIIGPAAFICAVVAAVALPMLHRIRFVKTVQGTTGVGTDQFLPFQKSLLSLALIAPYAAAAAYMAGVANFHFAGAFLAALYGAYYYFPSRKRIAQEMRLFRVTGGEAG